MIALLMTDTIIGRTVNMDFMMSKESKNRKLKTLNFILISKHLKQGSWMNK